MIRDIPVTPLSANVFAGFGTVIAYRRDERAALVDELVSRDAAARPHLDFLPVRSQPLPLAATALERHPACSQSFVPIEVGSYLVCVAPDSDGRPDLRQLRAFAARGDQSVTYGPGVWHHPSTALDRDGFFAVLTFRAGFDRDTEWFSLPEPVRLVRP